MKLSSRSEIVGRLPSLMPARLSAWVESEWQQSWQAPVLDRRGRLAAALLLTIASAAIVFARRPDQFLHPYIWVEEGVYTLRFYAENGWSTLFEPLAGYLLTASKLIDLTAFQLSILWAPEIAAGLAVAFTCAVVVAIALSPTHLKWPYVCALTTVLVPSNPEVFGTGSYAFWWAGLLLLLALLWTDERQWLRWVYLLVGGLSSPLIGVIVVLLALRLVVERNRRELVATLLAAAATVAQLVGMHAQAQIGVHAITTWPSVASLPIIAQKFVGAFFHAHAMRTGLAIAAAIALLAWTLRTRLDRYFVLLVLMFIAVAIAMTMRVFPDDLPYIDPFGSGPRYFFYPFILLSWILIWLAAVAPRPVQAVLAVAFALTLVLAGPRLSRRHDPLDWKQQVLACAQADRYEVPIHYIGSAKEMWHVKLTGAQCRLLLARSFF
jgi:uncharacterized membrane protein